MAHLAVHLAADGAAPTTAPLARRSSSASVPPTRRRPPPAPPPAHLWPAGEAPTANEFGDRRRRSPPPPPRWRGRRRCYDSCARSAPRTLRRGAAPMCTLRTVPCRSSPRARCPPRSRRSRLADPPLVGGLVVCARWCRSATAASRYRAARRPRGSMRFGAATRPSSSRRSRWRPRATAGGRQLGRGERGAARGRRRGGGGAGGACPSDLRAVGRPPSRRGRAQVGRRPQAPSRQR